MKSERRSPIQGSVSLDLLCQHLGHWCVAEAHQTRKKIECSTAFGFVSFFCEPWPLMCFLHLMHNGSRGHRDATVTFSLPAPPIKVKPSQLSPSFTSPCRQDVGSAVGSLNRPREAWHCTWSELLILCNTSVGFCSFENRPRVLLPRNDTEQILGTQRCVCLPRKKQLEKCLRT